MRLLLLAFSCLLLTQGPAQAQKQRTSRRTAKVHYTGELRHQEPRETNLQLRAARVEKPRQSSFARPSLTAPQVPDQPITQRIRQAREEFTGPVVAGEYGTVGVFSDLPPNTDLGVNDLGYVVTVDNDYLGVWGTDGAELLVQSWVDFFDELGAPLAEEILFPRVTVDPATGRFVVAVNYGDDGSNASLFVLISQTDDPTQGWLAYEFFSDEWNQSGFLNYLSVGLSTEEIFVTANVVDYTLEQVDVVIFQIDKYQAFDGNEVAFLFYNDFVDFDNYLGEYLHATQYDYSETVGPGMYFVSRTPDYVLLWDITSDIYDNETVLDLYEYPAPAYSYLTRANQLGSNDELIAGNGQVTDAFFAYDYVYFVHSAIDPATGRQGVQFWEVDALSEQMEGGFYSTPAYDMAYPSLCLVGEDVSRPEFLIGYQYSSESHYPGLGALFVETDFWSGGLVETALGTSPVDLNPQETVEYWGAYTGMVRQNRGSQATHYWQLGGVGEDFGYLPVLTRLDLGEVEPLQANFTTNTRSGTAPLTVAFTNASTGDPVSWSWSFPGGSPSSSTALSPTVTYSNIGDYDVSLTVTNEHGQQSTVYLENHISVLPEPPVAAFSASDSAGIAPMSVTFTDLSSNNPTRWLWEFEGGTPSISSAQNPVVSYTSAGTYSVTLTAFNDGGSDVLQVNGLITVVVLPPVAQFAVTDTSGTVPFTVTFTDQSTNSPTSWQWSFPGGSPSTSTARNPTVTYQDDGLFDVSLTVANSAGNDTYLLQDHISVEYLAPVAEFSVDDDFGPVPHVAQFTDRSTNSPRSWSWEFEGGDPTTSTAQHPQVSYNTPGTYAVTLTVTNPGGTDTKSVTDFITIGGPLPQVNFSADVVTGEAPLTVVFENKTQYGSRYLWTLAGGTPSSSVDENPVVVYENPGSFSVVLTAYNSDDESASVQRRNYIEVTQVTAIEEPDEPKLLVYPNPNGGNMTIRLPHVPDSEVSLQLFDAYGKAIRQQAVSQVAGRDLAWVVGGVPQGMYILVVSSATEALGKVKVSIQ